MTKVDSKHRKLNHKNSVTMLKAVEESGTEMRRQSGKYVGLCPFHEEKHPSFFIFHDGHFKCFGCGAYGDAIDFVQRRYGISFQEALKTLRVDDGKFSRYPKPRIVSQRQKCRQRLIKVFREWERETVTKLALLIRATNKAQAVINSIEDMERYGDILHPLPLWEHWFFDILCGGSDEDKFQLYLWCENGGII